MADVFISHSSKDKEIADKMCEVLEAKGLKCWIAPRDITPGSEWAVAISDAIATIKVMVVIYSANSAASTQVPKELGLADKRNKFIIPYKIDDMELTGAFDYYLAGAHWIVADIQAGEYKMEELYGVINGVMQMPQQSITNNTYIDKVTIEASVVKEFDKKIANKKLSKKWFVSIGILVAILFVMIALLVGILMKTDGKQEAENESKEIAIESTENKESTEKQEAETETEAVVEPAEKLQEASLQDFVYEIKNGEATIVGYKGTAPKVIIPSEIEGTIVTYIAEDAFYQCSNLESVEIPESVVGIGAWAFSETGLQNISIPASVEKIGEGAFCQCKNLDEVRLFNGVKEIGRAAFAETALEEISLPNSVIVVGEAAFNNCTQLSSVTLSSSLETVADYMFNGCTSLQKVNIPESVIIIGEFAFSRTFFENITIADTNIIQIGGGAFSECPDLKYVELPKKLLKIDDGAFQMCYNLETVVIPEGIKSISDNAFYDSKNVQIIMGENTYDYDTYWEPATELFERLAVNFQYEIGEDGIHITKYTGNEKAVVIPNEIEGIGVTAINYQAFANCESMVFLSIPVSVQRIESDAFAECVNLSVIAGGKAVTDLGEAVYRSTNILEAKIPNGQQLIGYAMFFDCPDLTSVYLPEGVRLIDELAFSQCPELKELRIPNSVQQIASNAFDGSENITLIYKGYRYSYEERHKIPVMVKVAE